MNYVNKIRRESKTSAPPAKRSPFLSLITMALMPAVSMASGVYDIDILHPEHDTDSHASIFDFGTLSVDGATASHRGYDLVLKGTEEQEVIRGTVNAVVGPASQSGPSYLSWEILRIDGMPDAEMYYDWTLDAHVTITSAANPTKNPDLYSDTVYGIIMHNFNAGTSKYNHIKEVAGSVKISDYQGLEIGNGNPAESLEGTAYGVEVGAYYDIKTLSSHVKIKNASAAVGYQFNTGTRIGVDDAGEAIEGAGITGKIEMHNVEQGVGILYSGTGDNNPSAAEPQVGYNSANIRISSDADYAVQAAVGYFVDGDGEKNEIKGGLTGIFDGNIDIDVYYDPASYSPEGYAIVTGVQIHQKESYDEDLEHIMFGDGASISAKYIIAGDETNTVHLGDAINLEASPANKTLNLTTQYDTDTVTLEGNIRAYYKENGVRKTQDLTFEQGVFNVSANSFEASSITLGSYDYEAYIMRDATLNLYESLAVEHVEHVDFFLQSYDGGQYSSINIAADETLTLATVDNINIYLGADLLDDPLYAFDIIAGDVQGLEGITFSVFDGTVTGGGALLWSFEMDGEYQFYHSEGIVTSHFFEVQYTEEGVKLVAYFNDNTIPEPSTITFSLLALSAMLSRRRRQAAKQR